jgi:hypothetical protein
VSLPSCQRETSDFLTGLAGHAPVETPISAVFLGEDTAWKLRKAVKLTFLDFTTLAERERTARRELELNAPTAPGMYRDVVPVTRGPQGLALGGDGEVIDWVVRMARVPEGDFLDVIAERGGLSPALLDGLADAVADLHAQTKPRERDPLAMLRDAVAGNQVSGHAAGLPGDAVDRWRDAMMAAIDARADWIIERGRAGFMRRTHGDLHLSNLCLWQGHPVAFDALEFSEAMATIDLGYDLAFLLMDLEIRAGRPAANRVLNRYVARTGDVGLVVGLPMFLSMRALVRAHVSCNAGKPWQGYLAFAEAALQPSASVVVAIGGLPGSGKSTLARGLAPLLGGSPGALVLRSDETRKRRFGLAPEQRLPPDAYQASVSRAVMAEVFAGVAIAARAGHAVIADLTFMARDDRKAVAQAAGSVPFVGVWLTAPPEVLEQRVAARVGDASDADVTVLRRALAADPGPGDWWPLDTTDPAALEHLTAHVTHATRMC